MGLSHLFGSDLPRRAGSSLVLAALAFGSLLIGGLTFAVVMGGMAAIVFSEWSRMTGPHGSPRMHWAMTIFVAIAVAYSAIDPIAALSGIFALVLLFAIAATLEAKRAWMGGGVLYAAVPPMALVLLRGHELIGLYAVGVIFATVWFTDSVAYFVGRAIGGPKLWPLISPKKTWSGAIGGLVGGIFGGLIIGFLAGVALLPLALVTAALSFVSALGDLAESALKRHFGVKDSGAIIPGHGGMMDRVDGLLAAALLAGVIGLLHGGLSHPAEGLMVW